MKNKFVYILCSVIVFIAAYVSISYSYEWYRIKRLVNKASEVKVGFTKNQVREILGNPDSFPSGYTSWHGKDPKTGELTHGVDFQHYWIYGFNKDWKPILTRFKPSFIPPRTIYIGGEYEENIKITFSSDVVKEVFIDNK